MIEILFRCSLALPQHYSAYALDRDKKGHRVYLKIVEEQ